MEFSEVVRRRRMTRHYSDKPLAPEVIERILASALRAPSTGFSQGWEDCAEARWPAPYWHIDTGMAALLMLLTAVDEGLGACFFGIMPKHLQPFREEFGVPDEYTPIGGITVGYRADDAPPQGARVAERRRSAGEVIHRGQWGRHA
ncbi:nitroreductase family protein [Streptomyces sp. NPDC050534]|uniref:nitroreductase family protein n=1 Tax=Streptomyces sp. NPDC050534 TaxID=3365625 RepID=UPI00379067C1